MITILERNSLTGLFCRLSVTKTISGQEYTNRQHADNHLFLLERNIIMYFFFVLFMLAMNASVQTDALQKFDFSTFTLDLPANCKSYPDEQSEECVSVRTPDKSFFCIVSAFTLEKRLREEAIGFNIDIDQSGLFTITTGTEYPLLCTMEDLGKAVMLIGVYPDYRNNRGIYINMLTTEKANERSSLAKMVSSLRLSDGK